jgi:hypothetical protein
MSISGFERTSCIPWQDANREDLIIWLSGVQWVGGKSRENAGGGKGVPPSFAGGGGQARLQLTKF